MGVPMREEGSSIATSNLFYTKPSANGSSKHSCGCWGAALGSKTPSPGFDSCEDKLLGFSFGLAHLENHLGTFLNSVHSFVLDGDPSPGATCKVST